MLWTGTYRGYTGRLWLRCSSEVHHLDSCPRQSGPWTGHCTPLCLATPSQRKQSRRWSPAPNTDITIVQCSVEQHRPTRTCSTVWHVRQYTARGVGYFAHRVDYGNDVYAGLPNFCINRLKSVVKAATRPIGASPKFSHISKYCSWGWICTDFLCKSALSVRSRGVIV